jgi:hypothetical protein
MSDTARRSTLGLAPDPDLQLPLAPGADAHREVVLVDEQPAMSEEDFAAAFQSLRSEARDYGNRLADARQRALRLYNGEAMGDEEDGRSQIVLTEVKDTIGAMMPTVIRVFCGAERPVEFEPHGDGDEEQAQQATDYVQYVTFTDCDGFRAIHDAALDAFQLKVGWIRWHWDTAVDVKTERYTGLLEPQAAALITQPGVRAMRVVRRPATDDERMGLQGSPEQQLVQAMPGVPLLVFDVTLTRRVPRNKPSVGAVASELVTIDPDASGPQDARGLFITREAPVSDLVALGFSEEKLLEHVTEPQGRMNNPVTRERDQTAASVSRQQTDDDSMRVLTYTDGWVRIDYDGDGIAELRRVQAVGENGENIIANEGASHIPLARIVPFLVPHKAVGESYADRVGDLQAINSRVMRNILDSMAEAIHPRTVILDGAVPPEDVMNTEMGAVIRERVQGAVRELQKPFVGPSALPLLDVLAAIKESRTGLTRASQGLNADVLQSTTAVAVSAQISAAQDRQELVLRCIAEGLKYLYSGVLELMCEHQDRARMVRLRGKWVPVDPRAWMSGYNVRVDPAVGRGTLAERMQVLSAIAGKQESLLQTLGPSNPIVTLGQYRNTLADMLAVAGISNVERYFRPVPIDWQPPPPPKQPSPDELLAQVEVVKSNNQRATDAADQRQKQAQMLLDDDRERDQSKVNALLQAADIQGKYPGAKIDARALSMILDRDPELTMALLMPAEAGAMLPGQPPPPPGAPPDAAGAPALPAAGPAQPGQSLADARVFLPPTLIQALAAYNRASSAGPQIPGPPAVR